MEHCTECGNTIAPNGGELCYTCLADETTRLGAEQHKQMEADLATFFNEEPNDKMEIQMEKREGEIWGAIVGVVKDGEFIAVENENEIEEEEEEEFDVVPFTEEEIDAIVGKRDIRDELIETWGGEWE